MFFKVWFGPFGNGCACWRKFEIYCTEWCNKTDKNYVKYRQIYGWCSATCRQWLDILSCQESKKKSNTAPRWLPLKSRCQQIRWWYVTTLTVKYWKSTVLLIRYPVTYSLWKAYIHCQSTVLEHFWDEEKWHCNKFLFTSLVIYKPMIMCFWFSLSPYWCAH